MSHLLMPLPHVAPQCLDSVLFLHQHCLQLVQNWRLKEGMPQLAAGKAHLEKRRPLLGEKMPHLVTRKLHVGLLQAHHFLSKIVPIVSLQQRLIEVSPEGGEVDAV